MIRGTLQKLMFACVLAGGLVFTSQADAGWYHWGGCYGPYVGWTGYSYSYYGGWGAGCCGPSYATYYSPGYCCDPCYTSFYPGCGLLARLRYRCLSHHYRYYGCYSPCYTSCCSVCGSYDCCCGSTTTGVIDYGVPADATQPTPANPPADGTVPETQTSITRDSAFLTVSVPSDARVLVNGVVTRSKGEQRRYVSRNLIPGFDYTYEVKAEYTVNGEPVTQTRTIQLQAGRHQELAFNGDAPQTVETALTLHVPEDAKVYLAGNETNGSGPVRTFRTTKLSSGQKWGDYVVRVVINRNGLVRSMEEKISLSGGDQRELSFDFDIDKVASIR